MDSLERQVSRFRTAPGLPAWLCDRIDAKYERHHRTYGKRLDAIAQSLKRTPTLIDQVDDLRELKLFFRSHIVIAVADLFAGEDLWCPHFNHWVPVGRHPNRVLIKNPFNNKAESWGRLQSASEVGYTAHRRVGGRQIKSRFLGNADFIEPLEHSVLSLGKGILLTDIKMRLYGCFEEPIGTSRHADELTYMCLEAERIRRPRRSGTMRQTGWMLRAHGYPMGSEDVRKDLQGTKLKLRDLPTIANPQ